MNLRRNIICLFLSLVPLLAITSCSDEDNAAIVGSKGYLQLHLNAAGTTRALGDMAEAKKVELELDYEGLRVTQTLALSSVPDAEGFGLTSEKIELLSGAYKLLSYTIYSAVTPGETGPKELAYGYPDESEAAFNITQGHLTEYGIIVQAGLSGKVSFNLVKDLSNYDDVTTRTTNELDEKLFQYDNISEVDITYKIGSQRERTVAAKVHKSADNDYFHTDTLKLVTGDYTITRVVYYDKRRQNIILVTAPNTQITVLPNILQKPEVKVTYPENMEAFSDYMALYEIWKAMDGPNWKYKGEVYQAGSNWRFEDRPIDEWGNQPGVQIDTYGRVKSLDLGSFNPQGDIPAVLGKLTALESLWLGKHDDDLADDGSTYKLSRYKLYHKGVDLKQNRLAIAREELALRHPKKSSSIYNNGKKKGFTYAESSTYDVIQGDIHNGITSIPKEIGNLKNLQFLYVANGLVRNLPDELEQLENLTDLEFYNCEFDVFPKALKRMSHIVAMNISNTRIKGDVDGRAMTEGLNAMTKASIESLQLLYAVGCGLTEFPIAMLDAPNLVLLDMADNKLKVLPQKSNALFAPKLAPIQAFFDNNMLTDIEQFFCGTDDIETFSATDNFLTKFPLLFNKSAQEGKYAAETIDFMNNKISSFDGFQGIRVETLTLSWNPIGEIKKVKGKDVSFFPSAFSNAYQSNSKCISILNLETANCGIDSISYENGFKDCFKKLEAWDLSGNNLRGIPADFNVETFPYLNGLNLNQNCFANFPTQVLKVQKLYKLYISSQAVTKEGTNGSVQIRCLRTFPTGLNNAFGLRYLDISGNDIYKIESVDFPLMLMEFNVSDNPNLEMTIPTSICTAITNGGYILGFDSSQYILGCPALDLDINK